MNEPEYLTGVIGQIVWGYNGERLVLRVMTKGAKCGTQSWDEMLAERQRIRAAALPNRQREYRKRRSRKP